MVVAGQFCSSRSAAAPSPPLHSFSGDVLAALSVGAQTPWVQPPPPNCLQLLASLPAPDSSNASSGPWAVPKADVKVFLPRQASRWQAQLVAGLLAAHTSLQR